MPLNLDLELRDRGTRFSLFAQTPALSAFQTPETVWVSPPAGSIDPGPADNRMVVRDAISKSAPYEYPYLPPYGKPIYPPVHPDAEGHFDYLRYGSREFQAAHMYGSLRRVLDIWEYYFERSIPWHFEPWRQRLELIPWIDWDNAQSGYGFIETGAGESKTGDTQPFCLNFDVLAHELGHSLIFSTVGIPTGTAVTAEYRGFQECSADMVALVSVLHFDSFVQTLLQCCSGNLYTENELNRIGELSDTDQIRMAANDLRMSDVVSIDTPESELSQKELHRLGEPLTGALFDLLVDIYQNLLLDRGLISEKLDVLARTPFLATNESQLIESEFNLAFSGNEDQFQLALLEARDYLGFSLARTWHSLQPDSLTFSMVGEALLEADFDLSDGVYQQSIREVFEWREINLRTTTTA